MNPKELDSITNKISRAIISPIPYDCHQVIEEVISLLTPKERAFLENDHIKLPYESSLMKKLRNEYLKQAIDEVLLT